MRDLQQNDFLQRLIAMRNAQRQAAANGQAAQIPQQPAPAAQHGNAALVMQNLLVAHGGAQNGRNRNQRIN